MSRRDTPQSSLLRALVISLGLHGLLLWPAPPVWQQSAVASVLQASLRPVAPSVATAAAVRVDEPAAPVGVSPTRQGVPADHGRQGHAAPPVSPAAGRVADAGLSEMTPSVLAPGAGLDAESVRAFRMALARSAGRFWHYPPAAIDAAWAGRVELRLSVRSGVPPRLTLEKSSGYVVLDAAALAMLNQALPATALPPGLEGQSFDLSLPVLFELPD